MKPLAALALAATATLPAAAHAQDWSGAYAGGSLALGSADLEVFDSDEYSAFGYARADGFFGAISARAGYNFQTGSIVYGPEVTLGFATHSSSEEFGFCSPTTVESEITGIASLRGRIGFAIDEVLLYGAAGAAYMEGNSEITCDTSYTDSVDSSVAFVAAIGAEYMYSDTLSLNFEYTAMRGDDEFVTNSDNPGGEDEFGFNTDSDTFSVGVNFHF